MRNSGASCLPCQFYWLVGVISLLSSSPDYRGMANSIADLKVHERRKQANQNQPRMDANEHE
jgi:hypothetical protein